VLKPTSAQGLVSINIKLGAGVSSENEYAGSGITHFIEHMIFKGTPEMQTGELARQIKSYGGYMNATTGLDATTFLATVPSDYADDAIELIGKAIINPSFSEKEIEKERSVILNEIRLNEDDPSRRIMRLLFEKAYQRHAYRFPIIGYRDLLKRLRRQNLISYHGIHYVPNNMVLAIAGDIDVEKMFEKVKETFGKYTRQPVPLVITEEEPEQILSRSSKYSAEINLGYFAIAYHSTGLMDSDLYPLDVFANILGQGDGSRLNKSLVKDKELLYSVNSFNYTPLYPGLFIISGIGAPEKLEEAVSLIESEIEEIKTKGISQEEFERAKAAAFSAHIKSLETVGSQAASLAEGQMFAGDPDFAEKYLDGIDSVRPEDVVRAVGKYLRSSNSSVVYLVPTSQISDMGEKDKVKALEVSRKAKKYILDNGIRVILKEEHSLPLVSLTLVCLGGLRAEPEGFNGISNLMSEMLLKGTKKRKESEIKASMERLGGYINSFSGLNSFGVAMEFLSKDRVDALDLLEDVVRNPTFPEEELEKFKEIVTAGIAAEEDNTFQKGSLKLRKEVFKGHPYGNRISGEPDLIADISNKDLEDFYWKLLNPKNMVISIVGDFNSEEMLDDIKTRFSEVKENEFEINVYTGPWVEKDGTATIRMPKKEAMALLGVRGVDVKNSDKYILEVIAAVMSGQDGRIFNSIRDNLGLSYSQGAGSVPALDPGYFFFYVATDEKNLEKAKEILLNEISKIRTEPVSDEELASAKKALIGRHMISMQTNSAKTFTIALDELYGLGYDDYRQYKENINKCSKSDIMKIANMFFNFNDLISVSVMPEYLEE